MSLTVPQPLKTASVAASAQNFESRFMIGTRPSSRQNQSVVLHYQHRFAAKLDDAVDSETGMTYSLSISGLGKGEEIST
jgi:hypothetical protein